MRATGQNTCPGNDLPFSRHHRPAFLTLFLKAGNSLPVRFLMATGRADAESSGTHAETAAAASTSAGAATAAHNSSFGGDHHNPPGQAAFGLAKYWVNIHSHLA